MEREIREDHDEGFPLHTFEAFAHFALKGSSK